MNCVGWRACDSGVCGPWTFAQNQTQTQNPNPDQDQNKPKAAMYQTAPTPPPAALPQTDDMT